MAAFLLSLKDFCRFVTSEYINNRYRQFSNILLLNQCFLRHKLSLWPSFRGPISGTLHSPRLEFKPANDENTSIVLSNSCTEVKSFKENVESSSYPVYK